jgi:hypothetical protein
VRSGLRSIPRQSSAQSVVVRLHAYSGKHHSSSRLGLLPPSSPSRLFFARECSLSVKDKGSISGIIRQISSIAHLQQHSDILFWRSNISLRSLSSSIAFDKNGSLREHHPFPHPSTSMSATTMARPTQSPMNKETRLPVEILGHILQSYPPIFSDVPGYQGYSPLLVSKFWKAVALSSQSLWSNISIGSREFYSTKTSAKLKRWLGRARTCDLSISITSHERIRADFASGTLSASTLNRAAWQANLDILSATSERWIAFDYWITSKEDIVPILSCLRKSARLEELDIGSFVCLDPTRVLQLSFPNLRHLRFYGGDSTKLVHSDYPWLGVSGVTTLTLDRIILDRETFHSFHHSMPNIQSLKMTMVEFSDFSLPVHDDAWECEHASITFQNLRSLDIQVQWYIPPSFLQCCSASPSLDSLAVTLDAGDYFGWQKLCSSLENCAVGIRNLAIRVYDGPRTFVANFWDMPKVFQRLSRLENIRIESI